MAEGIAGRPVERTYSDEARTGDHVWWISDVRKFQAMYPEWQFRYGIREIMEDIHAGLTERLHTPPSLAWAAVPVRPRGGDLSSASGALAAGTP